MVAHESNWIKDKKTFFGTSSVSIYQEETLKNQTQFLLKNEKIS